MRRMALLRSRFAVHAEIEHALKLAVSLPGSSDTQLAISMSPRIRTDRTRRCSRPLALSHLH
jgi:chromate transport protein ChrA